MRECYRQQSESIRYKIRKNAVLIGIVLKIRRGLSLAEICNVCFVV